MNRLRVRSWPVAAVLLVVLTSICGWVYQSQAQSDSAVELATARLLDPSAPCGPVSLAVVAALHDRPIGLADAKEIVPVDRLGQTSMSQLMDAYRNSGFAVAGVRLEKQSLSRLSSPVVLFVRDSHFLVGLTVSDTSIVVLDEPREPIVLDISAIEEKLGWGGEALVVAGNEAELKADLHRVGL